MFTGKSTSQKPDALLASGKSQPSQTIVGAGTEIEGTLTSAGHVRLDGTFEGDVTALGNVVIGEAGSLIGDLIGETVAIGGVVRGDVTARKVSILRTGRVLGSLRQEALFTEDGGFFQGMVTMENQLNIAALVAARTPTAGEVVEAALREAESAPEPEPISIRQMP